jgi:hypothetical protein
MTGMRPKTDVSSTLLHLGLEAWRRNSGHDFITGLRQPTATGRPHWDRILRQMKAERKGKMVVFYCGPPAMGDVIAEVCRNLDVDFRREHF